MEALRVQGLTKDFGGVRAANNISFSVEMGERLALIGPNGAGKTTLFNLLGGQLQVTSGKVYLLGHDVTNMPTYRRTHLGLGRSFQLNSLFLNLSVLDNVMLALQGTRPSRFQMFRPASSYGDLMGRAKDLLSAMNLWQMKDVPARAISYGEQRKLEIALSLASEAKLLLLDEPSAGLTAAEGADVIEMIRDLGQDITVVMVAHDMDLVFGMAKRIIVLHYGEVIADGNPDEIQANSRVKQIYMGVEETA
jgi:branched-chain amino acid transport system ATP-binding protein